MNWSLIFANAIYASLSYSTAAFALVAIGLNLHAGHTGLLNFGQAGFAAVGAYAMAIPISNYDWPWWLALLLVIGGSCALAVIVGITTLRLRSDYLAIVTIATAEIIRLVLSSVRFTWLTGGTDGKKGFSGFIGDLNPWPEDRQYRVWAQTISGHHLFMLLAGWTLAIIFSILIFLLMRSPWGRVLRSIREDEDAARSLGKNVFMFKMQSLMLGGVIGGFGGVILAAGKRSAQPSEYGTTLTFFAFTIVILGGIAREKGPLIGAIIFWFLLQFVDNILEQATRRDKVPEWLVDSNNFGQVKFIVAGFALAALVVFRPQGLFGDKREQAFDAR